MYRCYEQWLKSVYGPAGMQIGPLAIIFTSLAHFHMASRWRHAKE
jgi:hypothetical protein